MVKEKIAELIQAALDAAKKNDELRWDDSLKVELEQPKDKGHGDWATNVALALASKSKKPPREVAEILIKHINIPTYLEKVEIAGPGFINFWLSNDWLYEALVEICRRREKYGHADKPVGEKVQVEFVSANPVGPMHVGHGRWAAVGDALARLLTAAGYEVEREFYVNDFGNQMNIFGQSVAARYRQQLGQRSEFPPDGYQGHYITEIADEIIAADGDKYLKLSDAEQAEIFSERAYRQVLAHLKKILDEMDVHFDTWFSERELHKSGYLAETLASLKSKGYSYEQDGALWLKTTLFGDDKDRVLIRENGEPTYFAADIAYHRHKLERGYDKIINIWGADHHGYVKRMQAAMTALGAPEGSLEIIIGQLVNLFSGGRPIRMSKRTGEMVTLEELLTEVGKDPARYFFLMRSTDTPLDFDIELAKSRTSDNPVYYVQYAHARICSILKNAAKAGLEPVGEKADLNRLAADPELALLRMLAGWPMILNQAAAKRQPYRLTKFAEELASTFHFFYHECRVISEDKELSLARLTLADCTRLVLENVLTIIGVDAPEQM